MYYVVEFVAEKTVDYIPQEWMIDLKNAYWPTSNVTQRRKQQEQPSENTNLWKPHAIRVLGTADYENEAVKKARRAENDSNLSSSPAQSGHEEGNAAKKPRSSRPPLRYRLDDDSGEDQDDLSEPLPPRFDRASTSNKRGDVLPTIPRKFPDQTTKCSVARASSVIELRQQSTISSKEQKATPTQNLSSAWNLVDLTEQTVDSPGQTMTPSSIVGARSSCSQRMDLPAGVLKFPEVTSRPRGSTNTDDLQTLAVTQQRQTSQQQKTSWNTAPVQAGLTAFEKFVVSSLTELTETSRRIELRLCQLEAKFSSSRGESLPSDLPVTLPVTSIEDVEQLNDYLSNADTRKQLVNYFGVVGFGTPQDATRYIMQQLLTIPIATAFNWEGRGGAKRGFKEMANICMFVQCAVRRSHTTASIEVVKCAMQNWLKYASDKRKSSL